MTREINFNVEDGTSGSFRLVLLFARQRLRQLFDFSQDDADEQELIETVKKNMSLQGANLWVLIFAIVIASVGLNTNSTAVIIGAMLISPLMGPITGIGFGAAILDFSMVRTSIRSLVIAVITSVLASALYFSISPLSQASSELLARTTPTAYDVLIALFGGLAVTLASTRKNKSASVIAGASIATALMPPLCTVGYSIAHQNANYFFGAFYLFAINCIYICLATYLITRMLDLRQCPVKDPLWSKYLPRFIAALAILTLFPSIYLAYRLVQWEIMQEKVSVFIEREIVDKDIRLLQQKLENKDGKYLLKLVLLGDYKKSLGNELLHKLTLSGLSNVDLRIEDTLSERPSVDLSQLKSGLLEELVIKNEKLLKHKEEEIADLKNHLAAIEKERVEEDDILRELVIEHPQINSLVLQRKKNKVDEYNLLGYVESKSVLGESEKMKIQAWLKVRTKSDQIHISFGKKTI